MKSRRHRTNKTMRTARSIRLTASGAVLVSLLMLIGTAGMTTADARGASSLSARQYSYPGYFANWHKGEGLADSSGKSFQALHLEKTDPLAAAGHSAGVSIGGVSGTTLTELGFDVRGDGICLESPQFSIYLKDASEPVSFSCGAGEHSVTPGADGWTRVRFSSATGLVVDRMFLRFELPVGVTGFTHVDNIDINGSLIGKA